VFYNFNGYGDGVIYLTSGFYHDFLKFWHRGNIILIYIYSLCTVQVGDLQWG
jgi:hypothetical protein